MAITLVIDGESDILAASLDAFVRHHGWDDGHELTQSEFAKDTLVRFFREGVTAHNVEVARLNAADAAKQASKQNLDALTSTLNAGSIP